MAWNVASWEDRPSERGRDVSSPSTTAFATMSPSTACRNTASSASTRHRSVQGRLAAPASAWLASRPYRRRWPRSTGQVPESAPRNRTAGSAGRTVGSPWSLDRTALGGGTFGAHRSDAVIEAAMSVTITMSDTMTGIL